MIKSWLLLYIYIFLKELKTYFLAHYLLCYKRTFVPTLKNTTCSNYWHIHQKKVNDKRSPKKLLVCVTPLNFNPNFEDIPNIDLAKSISVYRSGSSSVGGKKKKKIFKRTSQNY